MAVRKSNNIGKTIAGYIVLDSKHVGSDTKLLLECTNCHNRAWKSRGFLKNGGKCPECHGGRNYRKAEGLTKERLYERYRNILRRVKDPRRYKGVTICKEWENNYQAFREWALNHGYEDNLTIDRIDNSKGYEPNNCRWVTIKEQANNRTNNTNIIYEGKQYTISQLAEKVGLPYGAVLQRVNHDWSIEDVVKTPYKSRKKWSEMTA